ncbi:MAG TPA: DUF354 domain-containing protein [bacterium]|nr:DUF354 domain-containing protein [bacterium]HPN42144.1 DUF354 domain-containing protein [bacterium]
MRVLFFLGHPAHYHLFKYIIKELNRKNNQCLIVIKEKEMLESLLINDNLKYSNVLPAANKRRKHSKLAILYASGRDLLIKDFKLFNFVKNNKPDIMIGTETSITHIGRLLNVPSLVLNEDDAVSQPEFCYPTYTFVNHIITPHICNNGKWKNKQILYNGYHELAYLAPNYFTPDKEKIKEFNPSQKPYFILRFVSLNASHDIGKKGLTLELSLKLIELLKPYGEIFITSERKLEKELEQYRIKINPNNIHNAIYYSQLLIADSQTMAAEAAVLGTPSIRFNDFVGKLGYLEELEHKYCLTFGIKTSEPEKLLNKVQELLTTPELKKAWQMRKDKMFSETIDVTAFMVWFIENYPQSFQIMKNDPNYQNRFAFSKKNM